MKETLLKALKEAGKLVLDNFRKTTSFEYKEGNDIVLQIDKDSENLIKSIIQDEYSDHNILAEESGELKKDSEFLWVIDPVDGTKNYACGLKHYCVSIGLMQGNEMILGGVYAPSLDEIFIAEKGKGTTFNGKRIMIKPTLSKNSIMAINYNHYTEDEYATITSAINQFRKDFRSVRSFGSSALDMSYIANGILGAYVSLQSGKWDKLAAALIVKEAGGLVYGSLESKQPIIAVASQESYNLIQNTLSKQKENKRLREILTLIKKEI